MMLLTPTAAGLKWKADTASTNRTFIHKTLKNLTWILCALLFFLSWQFSWTKYYGRATNSQQKYLLYLRILFYHCTYHKDEIPDKGSANTDVCTKSACLCTAQQAKNNIMFLSDRKKQRVLRDTWKLFEIQISVS